MVAVSLDGKMVDVCVCIPISTPTLSGISQFFSGKKVAAPPPKSEGARTPMFLTPTEDMIIEERGSELNATLLTENVTFDPRVTGSKEEPFDPITVFTEFKSIDR